MQLNRRGILNTNYYVSHYCNQIHTECQSKRFSSAFSNSQTRLQLGNQQVLRHDRSNL